MRFGSKFGHELERHLNDTAKRDVQRHIDIESERPCEVELPCLIGLIQDGTKKTF